MVMMGSAARRHPWVVGVAIALLLGGSIVAAVMAMTAEPGATPGDLRLVYPSDDGDNRQQIIAVDREHGARELGLSVNFASVRISLDGRYIAALTGPQGVDFQTHLHLIEWSSGDYRLVPFRGTDNLTGISWSPSSDVVALVGQTSYLIGLDGTTVAKIQPPIPPGYTNRIDSGGFDWSPDGELFVSVANGSVTQLRRGFGRFVEGSAITTGDGAALSLVGWVAPDGPVVEYAGERIVVGMSGDNPNLAQVGNREVIPVSGRRGVSVETRGRAMDESAGMREAWSRMNTAGDYIVEFREPGDRSRIVVVSADAERVRAADISYPAGLVRDGGLVDALLVNE